jgi:Ca2+-binding EF-hand superfamily protein
MDEETILQIIEECDKNKDGWIDYNEFLAMMSED